MDEDEEGKNVGYCYATFMNCDANCVPEKKLRSQQKTREEKKRKIIYGS